MYKSPITIYITEDIERRAVREQEEYILSQIKMAVDVDEKELIRALQYDRDQYGKGYSDGRAERDAEIVRCKDCVYAIIDPYGISCTTLCMDTSDDHYCWWGERREDEAD